jgi:hypothetical protein
VSRSYPPRCCIRFHQANQGAHGVGRVRGDHQAELLAISAGPSISTRWVTVVRPPVVSSECLKRSTPGISVSPVKPRLGWTSVIAKLIGGRPAGTIAPVVPASNGPASSIRSTDESHSSRCSTSAYSAQTASAGAVMVSLCSNS